jgi:RNA polymerase sigma-70 factor, ECF subfamily
VLCDIEGFSYEEIAATLGVKLGTVRSRIHRGRAQLRTALEHRRPATVEAAKSETANSEAANSEAANSGPGAEARSARGQGLRRPGLVPRLKRSGGS